MGEIGEKNRSGLPPRTPLFNKVNFLILNLLIWETVCREEAVFLPPKNLLDRWFSAGLRPKFKNLMCLQNPFHLLKEIITKTLRKEFCSNPQDSLYNSSDFLPLKFIRQSRSNPSKLDLSLKIAVVPQNPFPLTREMIRQRGRASNPVQLRHLT